MINRVFLLSGGMDSALVLAEADRDRMRHNFQDSLALTFDYGQPHVAEIHAAERIAGFFGVPWRCVDLRDAFSIAPSGLLSGDDTTAAGSVVSLRNGIFLSVAASLSPKEIYIGSNAGDIPDYPDCRPEFIKATQAAFEFGGVDCEIIAPLMDRTKAEVVRDWDAMGIPLDTISCYRGTACGECSTCRAINGARS
jgi:7-cyano-7-deazaguanine synthase